MNNKTHTNSLISAFCMIAFWAISIGSSISISENAIIITAKTVAILFWCGTAIITLALKKDFREKTKKGSFKMIYDFMYASFGFNFMLMATTAYINWHFFNATDHILAWMAVFAFALFYSWRYQRASIYLR